MRYTIWLVTPHKKIKMQVYVYGEMGDNSKVMMELTPILEEG